VNEPGDFRQARDRGIAGRVVGHGPSITRKPGPAQEPIKMGAKGIDCPA
jgi:hypothetical protein